MLLGQDCTLSLKFSLGFYESKEVSRLNRQIDYISDYSIEINQLYKLPIKDPLKLKNDLWKHLEGLAKEMYPNAMIFDIQFAMSDTGYLDLLEVLRDEKHSLKLIQKRVEKGSNQSKKMDKQTMKVNKAQQKIDDYKTNYMKSYPVKGFVTFNTIEAAEFIKKIYSACCCRSCISSYKKY